MSDQILTPKRPRGKPKGYRKPNAKRVTVPIRWEKSDLEYVKAAAAAVGEDFSDYVRISALARAKEQQEL